MLGKPRRFEEFSEPTQGSDAAIVHVRAAALRSVDKQLANGAHYASPWGFPVECGTDGHLADGTWMFFGGPRRPHGAMAQSTVVRDAFCFPLPEGVDDETAAAPNPGMNCIPANSHDSSDGGLIQAFDTESHG